MNRAIIFCVGCFTFVVMFLIKYPIKKMSKSISVSLGYDGEAGEILRRRLNILVIFFVLLTALASYHQILLWMNETHVKLCCALKGAALAMAFYAIFEQWIGDSTTKEMKKDDETEGGTEHDRIG